MSDATKKGIALASSILSAALLTVSTTMNYEGWKNVPYYDSTGKLTVCNGETHNINPHHYYSDLECIRIFVVSLVQHGSEIAPCLPQEGLPDAVRAEFTDFGYNVGTGNFCKSSVSRLAKAGDFAGACRAIGLYVYAGGKDCHVPSNNCYGIIVRRDGERIRCLKALGITEK